MGINKGKKSSEDIDDLHQRAINYAQQGKLKEAKDLLEKAITLAPNSADLYGHLGNVYRQLKEYKKAVENFEGALKIESNQAETHNNYGLLFYQQGQFIEAEKHFTAALKAKSDYIHAMYNLALALKAQGKTEEAVASLMAIIEVKPNYIRAHFLLAKLLIDKKLYDDAEEHFQTMVSIQSNDINILTEILACWLERDQYEKAKIYCEKILKLAPDNIEILYNLGIIETKLNHPKEALFCYQKVLKINPDYFPALNNIAVLYLNLREVETAKTYFQKALKLQPDNKSIQYTLSALSGQQVFRDAPQEYIKNLFDGYADHFEKHLKEGLEYKVPELLKQHLQAHIKEAKPNWNILDLGCGTGLSGQLFKSLAKTLIGVDLSPKMIEVAKQKNCYDELVVTDILSYLADKVEVFDLILAADVFVYQGDLESIFLACYKSLTKKGLFAFTTEIYEGKDFVMHATGRFCHSLEYVKKIAEKAGFTLLFHTRDKTRLQKDQSIEGYYFILQKG